MKLITVEDYQLKVADEALLIRPIRRLWHQDRSERKEKFYQQMSYMYHMVDPRSGYTDIVDEDLRRATIIAQEGLPSDFTPSDLLKEAMECYRKQITTMSQELLAASLIGASKVAEFLRGLNLYATDDKGRPKYQISSVTQALGNVEKITASLQNLQKKVEMEIEEKGKARGTQELTIMDTDFEQ